MTGTATCACGKSSVSVDGEVRLNGICHCNNCKRRTGSAYGWSVYVDDSAIKSVTGDLTRYPVSGDPAQDRWFCSSCGTTLYWKSDYFEGWTGLAGGAFPAGVVPVPDAAYHSHTALDWSAAEIPPHQPDSAR